MTIMKPLSKNAAKHIRSLKLNKYRNTHNEFVAEGKKVVLDIIQSDLHVKYVVCLKQWVSLFDENVIDVMVTDEKIFDTLSSQTNAAGILAVVEKKQTKEIADNTDIVLALDAIRDPGNMGTIIRTADWFGIKNIICSHDCVDVYNPKVIQSTMGSLARVNVISDNLVDAISSLKDKYTIYGTFLDGYALPVEKSNMPSLIIIGSESHGICSELEQIVDKKIKIPSFVKNENDVVESLNASIATAIVCYEFRR